MYIDKELLLDKKRLTDVYSNQKERFLKIQDIVNNRNGMIKTPIETQL